MGGIVDAGEMLKIEMGIDLCASDGRVPEQFLDCAKISAGLQDMAREAVSQHVWMHVDA